MSRDRLASAGLGMAGGIILGMLSALAFTWGLATKAAESVVAPVRQELAASKARADANEPHIQRLATTVETLAPQVQAIALKVEAICRATPRANCN